MGTRSERVKRNLDEWTPQQSLKLYDVPRWGSEFFSINQLGNLSLNDPAIHED